MRHTIAMLSYWLIRWFESNVDGNFHFRGLTLRVAVFARPSSSANLQATLQGSDIVVSQCHLALQRNTHTTQSHSKLTARLVIVLIAGLAMVILSNGPSFNPESWIWLSINRKLTRIRHTVTVNWLNSSLSYWSSIRFVQNPKCFCKQGKKTNTIQKSAAIN